YRILSFAPSSAAPEDSIIVTLEFTPKAVGRCNAIINSNGGGFCMDSAMTPIERTAIGNSEVYKNESSGFSLGENFPNPFNHSTTFSCTIPKESEVRISLSDMTGKIVKIISSGRISEGEHRVTFDASDLASGSYILSLESGAVRLTREIILAK